MRVTEPAAVGASPVLEQPVRRPRRQDQDTSHLRRDQASNLLNAWAFAEHQLTPLDLHVVVHWERLNLIAGQSILAQQAKFLDRVSKWLRKRQKPMAYLWTIEFSAKKGHHTHLLLSAKQLHPRALGNLLRSLPKLLTGDDTTLHPCVIRVECNNSLLPHDPSRRGRVAHTEGQRRGLVAYGCKGFTPDVAARVGINAENQGEVRFRRCGVSRSLDWSARRRAGWTEQSLDQFDFSDLAAKRRHNLEMASQRRSGAPGNPQPAWRAFPMPESLRPRTDLGGVPTALGTS
jgi:hypothetical protein